MPQQRRSAWTSAVVIGCVTGIALTSDWLPERVASHFGLDGFATAFMPRQLYLAVMLGIGVGVPALVSVMVGFAARRFPQFMNVPNRDYWLADERRAATAAYLERHTAWLTAGLAAFALAVHVLVIQANRVAPPRLATGALTALLAALGGLLVVWITLLSRHFRRG